MVMSLSYFLYLPCHFRVSYKFHKWSTYLPEVAGYFDIVPGVVIELSIHWFHNGFKGSRAQVDDQGDGAVFQRQIDIISWLARVQDQTIALPGLEG